MVNEVDLLVCDDCEIILLGEGDSHVCMNCEKPMHYAKFMRQPTPRVADALRCEVEGCKEHEDIIRLLTIIKLAPSLFGKTDSELAQEYRNWYLGSRLNLKAAEQSFTPDVCPSCAGSSKKKSAVCC